MAELWREWLWSVHDQGGDVYVPAELAREIGWDAALRQVCEGLMARG